MSNFLKKWSVEDTCTLIKLYRKFPILWDKRNPYYKNKIKISIALKEIGTELNTEPKEVERKLKNVYSQYIRERRKYKNMKKSGVGKEIRAKWFGYSLMKFLHDRNNKPRGFHDVEESVDQVIDSSSSSYSEDQTSAGLCLAEQSSSNLTDKVEVKSEITEDHVENFKSDVQYCSTIYCLDNNSKKLFNSSKLETQLNKNPIPAQTTNSNKNDDRIREVHKMRKYVKQSRQEREIKLVDDFDVFGDIVARKLRTFRTNYAQSTVQHLINNILYEAEMGRYDKPINFPTHNLNSSMVSAPCGVHFNTSNFHTTPELTERNMSNYFDSSQPLLSSTNVHSHLNYFNIEIKPEPSSRNNMYDVTAGSSSTESNEESFYSNPPSVENISEYAPEN